MTFLWTELHCYSRVQRHWHHHCVNSQWHQPSGKEEDGPRVGAEGKWMLCTKRVNSEIKRNFIVGVMWVFVVSQYSQVPKNYRDQWAAGRAQRLFVTGISSFKWWPVLRWEMQALRICWGLLKLLPVKNLKLMKTVLLLLSFYVGNGSAISRVTTTFLTLYCCCLICSH